MTRLLKTLLLLLAVPGCASLGSGEPPAEIAGIYSGMVDIGTDEVRGTLVLEQRGRRLEGSLEMPGVAAAGRGEIEGAGFVLELDYGDDCEGVITLSGRSADGQQLIGSLQAEDCTGRIAGSFTFRRGS